MFELSWWAWSALALGVTQVVIMLVTVYFHRAMAHRAVELSPGTLRVFRFLSWFLLSMDPREFAAVHRKHHAHCDTEDDPHSPVRFGWWGVLTRGLALYRREAADPKTIEKYGKGLPSDPWEGFYQKHKNLGIILQGILWTGLFGPKGLLLWGLVLAWIPFWAAGVVNGLGHAFGYRRFDTDDLSTNLVPWGLWIGGEELHNNHHADPSSPKFSKAWYEIDLGWGMIQVLRGLRLAKVRPVAASSSPLSDLLRRRYAHLRSFRQAVNREASDLLRSYGFRHWRQWIRQLEHPRRNARAQELLVQPLVKRLHDLDEGLRSLWAQRQKPDVLARAFQDWLNQAWDVNAPAVHRWCEQLAPAK